MIMGFTKTNWKDRIIERPNTYNVENNVDGTITLTPVTGVVTQAGTPLSANNLNAMEDRIGSSLEQKANKKTLWNEENYIQRGQITPKLIQNSLDTIFVTTQRPSKQGYVRFRMRSGVVTTNESQGGEGEFLRVVEVVEVVESFLMNSTPSAKSNPSNFGTSNINYVITGVGQQSIPCNTVTTKAIGNWIEFQFTTPAGIREIETLIYKSSGSSANIDISIDGVNILTGQSFYSTTSGFFRIKIPLVVSGTHTIRFTTNTADYMTIAGVNLVELKNFKNGYSYDYAVNINNTNGNQYVATNGSMDYALLDADTNLWCGSYHGGETRNLFNLIFDNTISSLTDGQFKVCNTFEVEQETSITSKISTYSRQIFRADGERELQVYFLGNINLKTLFVNMSTTLDSYTEVIYPVKDSTSLTSGDRLTLKEGCNYVIQRNPSNRQKCITVLNNNKINSTELPFIKKLIGSYCKLYNSNIQSETGVNFQSGQFRVVHIFD